MGLEDRGVSGGINENQPPPAPARGGGGTGRLAPLKPADGCSPLARGGVAGTARAVLAAAQLLGSGC